MSEVNSLNPEILETDSDLAFQLAYQKLIEMIRSDSVAEALQFAHEELVPRCERNVPSPLSRSLSLSLSVCVCVCVSLSLPPSFLIPFVHHLFLTMNNLPGLSRLIFPIWKKRWRY